MTAFLIEVPAHVQSEPRVQNNVQVNGGSNWDLSRGAVVTPIYLAPEPEVKRPTASKDTVLDRTPYEPSHRMPDSIPAVTVTFPANSAVIPAASQRVLRSLPRNTPMVVAGHADPDERAPERLARQRAEAVTNYLKRNGRQVELSKDFGAELPKTLDPFKAVTNRRVEVFKPEK